MDSYNEENTLLENPLLIIGSQSKNLSLTRRNLYSQMWLQEEVLMVDLRTKEEAKIFNNLVYLCLELITDI